MIPVAAEHFGSLRDLFLYQGMTSVMPQPC